MSKQSTSHDQAQSTGREEQPVVNRLATEDEAIAAHVKFSEIYGVAKALHIDNFFDFEFTMLGRDKSVRVINILPGDYNDTGYLNGLSTAVLPGIVGSRYIGLDKHGRRVVVIQGDYDNNIVMFERHKHDFKSRPLVVVNVPHLYQGLVKSSGGLNEDAFLSALDLIENLAKYEKRVQAEEERRTAGH